MSKYTLLAVIVILLVFVGGAAFLAAWDIPPPTARVEKVIGNDRLPR